MAVPFERRVSLAREAKEHGSTRMLVGVAQRLCEAKQNSRMPRMISLCEQQGMVGTARIPALL